MVRGKQVRNDRGKNFKDKGRSPRKYELGVNRSGRGSPVTERIRSNQGSHRSRREVFQADWRQTFTCFVLTSLATRTQPELCPVPQIPEAGNHPRSPRVIPPSPPHRRPRTTRRPRGGAESPVRGGDLTQARSQRLSSSNIYSALPDRV